MPVLPESPYRAFFLDLGIWYLFISHHSHNPIRHETQTLLHDCISQDRAFFHDFWGFGTCSLAIIGTIQSDTKPRLCCMIVSVRIELSSMTFGDLLLVQ